MATSEFNDVPNNVIIDRRDSTKVIVEEQVTHVEIAIGGPQGPPGIGIEAIPSIVSYRHIQSATSSQWEITHNLNFYPSVTIFDSANSMVEGEIIHNDDKNITLNFSAPISGTAYLS